MLEGIFSKKLGITTKLALINVILVVNAFVWYFYAATILEEMINRISDYFLILLMWSIHFVGLIFSALVGGLLTNGIKKRTSFLVLWMIFGVTSSFALIPLNTTNILGIVTLSLLFGISLGLGMPNCMGLYTDYTSVENRGSLGGVIMLASSFGIFFLRIMAVESIALKALMLAAWRASGLVIFILTKPYERMMGKKEKQSYRFILNQRSFILYFIPWIMFSLVNYLSLPVQHDILGQALIQFLLIINNCCMGVSAVVGGFLSDRIGRKRIAIVGFVLLGLSYSILGIYPEALFSWYFYAVIDGVAWGVLFIIFVITVWGDLSYGASSDKYYAVGMLPFFVSKFLQLIIGEYIAAIIPPYAIFSFIAFFLFLAVIPLMYAPETLPEKTLRERELRGYVEKAKKMREKFT